MIIKSAELEKVVGYTSAPVRNRLPEVALAGKSNVGKSSLINALVNRKALARTSGEPGKTQTINYYLVNRAFYLVDLPGYGYAKSAQSEREKWGRMIERYLQSSKVLRNVFLLIDIRHDPGENDKLMYRWIRSVGYEPVIIATKADKIKRSQLARQVKAIREGLQMEEQGILIPFSAKTRQGRDEVLAIVEAAVADSMEEPDV